MDLGLTTSPIETVFLLALLYANIRKKSTKIFKNCISRIEPEEGSADDMQLQLYDVN